MLEDLALSFIIMYQDFMVELNIITTYWSQPYCEETRECRVWFQRNLNIHAIQSLLRLLVLELWMLTEWKK